MNPISHAYNQYSLINVLKNFINGELEYFEEMKQVASNKKELIHIYPRMFFWKKTKAKKLNDEIILEWKQNFKIIIKMYYQWEMITKLNLMSTNTDKDYTKNHYLNYKKQLYNLTILFLFKLKKVY